MLNGQGCRVQRTVSGQYTETKRAWDTMPFRAGSEYAPTWGGSVNGGVNLPFVPRYEGQDTDNFTITANRPKINEQNWYRAVRQITLQPSVPGFRQPSSQLQGNPAGMP